jgi:hypothetical protein
MSIETTIGVFAAALSDPCAPTPPMTRGRMGAPDARRFAVYRNNVAVGLMGALEARYPVSRRIAGDDLFRAMARAFVRAHRPRSPVMIAYGWEFPEFAADYLAAGPEAGPSLEDDTFGRDRHREEPQGVERPSMARNDDGRSNQVHHATASLPDVARLENAWVDAYHSEDAAAAAVGDLAALNADCVPGTRIVFHPAARLLRFATPAASNWASAQNAGPPVTLAGGLGEDALIARPDCDVSVRVLPAAGYEFALRLLEGASLIEAATAMNDPGFDFGSHLVGLVESGAVASIVPGQMS